MTDRRIVTFGFNAQADVRAVNLSYDRGIAHLDIELADGAVIESCTLPMPGDHNVSNALAAVAVARHLGMKTAEIRDALASSDERTRTFAIIDLRTNGLTIGLQVFVTGRIAARYGLSVTLVIVPVVVLAGFWVAHFMLWTFGDMFTLLQEMGEPVTESLFLFIAPTTAIVQALMIAFNLVGPRASVRTANLVVAPVYLLFNVGYFVDATQGWEYYLGAFYVLFNLLIVWRAYDWGRNRG